VEKEWKSIPYGKPLANQTYHVLKPDLSDCPEWVIGDLYIGGMGLAKGYLKDLVQAVTKALEGNPALSLDRERLKRSDRVGPGCAEKMRKEKTRA